MTAKQMLLCASLASLLVVVACGNTEAELQRRLEATQTAKQRDDLGTRVAALEAGQRVQQPAQQQAPAQPQPQQPAAAAPAAAQPSVPDGEHPECPKDPDAAAALLGATRQNWTDLGTGGRTWRKWKFDGRGQTVQLRYPGWGSYDDYHPEYGNGFKGPVRTNESTFNCHR